MSEINYLRCFIYFHKSPANVLDFQSLIKFIYKDIFSIIFFFTINIYT